MSSVFCSRLPFMSCSVCVFGVHSYLRTSLPSFVYAPGSHASPSAFSWNSVTVPSEFNFQSFLSLSDSWTLRNLLSYSLMCVSDYALHFLPLLVQTLRWCGHFLPNFSLLFKKPSTMLGQNQRHKIKKFSSLLPQPSKRWDDQRSKCLSDSLVLT